MVLTMDGKPSDNLRNDTPPVQDKDAEEKQLSSNISSVSCLVPKVEWNTHYLLSIFYRLMGQPAGQAG
jgi:hypothetical protein